MGILRFLLSLAVLIGHSGPLFGASLVPPSLAVETFYMISGFYMSLVLGSKYSLNQAGIKRFYLNRVLRLAPTYWFILLLSVLSTFALRETFYLPARTYFNTLTGLSIPSASWIIFTNIFALGQDTIMFLQVSLQTASLHFTNNFAAAPFSAHKMLLVPQAWSLGVELWFYLLAPLLVKQRSWLLVGIALISLSLKTFLNWQGLDYDPWTYRFFPCELSLFVLGMLMFRVYSYYNASFRPYWGRSAFFVLILFIFIFSKVPLDTSSKGWIFLTIAAVSLPPIFNWSRSNKVDRLIGEFSYPLYISHLLIFQILSLKFPALFGNYPGPTVFCFSMVLSAAIYFFIEAPIDRSRHQARSS